MSKLTLPTLASGYLDVDKLNSIFQQIEDAFELVVYRDGTAPNQMEASLDLNGFSVLNAQTSDDGSSLVTRDYLDALVLNSASGFVVSRVETVVADPGQTVVGFDTLTYEPGSNNLAVYVDGVRGFEGTLYTETSSTSITMASPLGGGENISVQTNEYLSTITIEDHTHLWADITDPPEEATRWPTYDEVTGKPATFAPATHAHSTSDITSGNGLADARRGVWVQAGTPTATRTGDLWFN